MLTLRDVPNPRNVDFWNHSSGDGDRLNIIV